MKAIEQAIKEVLGGESDDEISVDKNGNPKSITFTSRKKGKGGKNSLYQEDGTIVSDGSDTLNNMKLLNNIGKAADRDGERRCETPPEFVDSDGKGYTHLIGKSINV